MRYRKARATTWLVDTESYNSLALQVKNALGSFSAEEQQCLVVFVSFQTGEFEFIGFIDTETGKAIRPSDKQQLEALDLLDEEYRRCERMVLYK